jgi:hypothetical protein
LGNRLGWSISGGIVILYAGFVATLFMAAGISPPTEIGRDPETFGAISLSPDPQWLMDMTLQQDAGPIYRKALAAYDEGAYEDFRQNASPAPADAAKLPGMELILQAAPCAFMHLFSMSPETIVNYDNEEPDLDHLGAMGEAGVRAALVFKSEGDAGSAKKYAEAAFSLGAKLYDERLTLREFYTGARVMSGSAMLMSELEPEKKDSWSAEVEALKQNTIKAQSLQQAIDSVNGETIAEHAGDVFVFADKAQEKMWRVQAILALGRMRYNIGESGRKGDQIGAIRRVRELLADPESCVHAAAKAAYELTSEKYNTIRG